MTYSIVAFDPRTNQLGAAVQSRFPAVGGVVPWVRAGVGAVATQAEGTRYYGVRGLELLAEGTPPADVLARLLAADPDSETRQVGVVSPTQGATAHTGAFCTAHAGHVVGDSFAVQANLMRNDGVPEAMAEAFLGAEKVALADRLMLALEAAERAGGDLRGMMSAALVVVDNSAAVEHWDAIVYDLRTDEHQRPLRELARLLGLQRAFRAVEALNGLVATSTAAEVAAAASNIRWATDSDPELAFWAAIALTNAGDLAAAVPLFQRAFNADGAWKELLVRLPGTGYLNIDPRVVLDEVGSDSPAARPQVSAG